MKKFRSKIGPNHGKPHSRIWIEGKRLVEARFTVGAKYDRVPCLGHDQGYKLRLNPNGGYVVSGKKDKPIIDITGSEVAKIFPPPITHVDVDFTDGVITITAANENH